mmetsp:Transcript_5437/g.7119  ORF Transcript_5437/g.7119 Transcript_5437/m.7119 type:complete len:149 (-) Transcript_5437:436-882(-)
MSQLVSLLDKQYDVTLDYCNAFTALHNTTAEQCNDSDAIHAVLQDLMHKVSRVQRHRQQLENLLLLEQNDLSVGRLREAYKNHVECTKRVLATIHHVNGAARLSPIGVPLAAASTNGESSTETQTLALVTLRASIQNFCYLLEAIVED